MSAPGQAQQGHRYLWCGVGEVLALDSGQRVRVAPFDVANQWLGAQFWADAADLTPLPMRYYHGEVR